VCFVRVFMLSWVSPLDFLFSFGAENLELAI